MTPLWLLAVLPSLQGCDSKCLGRDCEPPEEIPWDPGEDGDGDGYGGGSGGGSGGSGDTGEEEAPREILTVRDCDVTVQHKPTGDYTAVQVSGEFNAWTPADMEGPDEEGYWSVDLGALDPGEYAFKYVYDGAYEGDPPVNVYSKWLDGSENRDLRVGDCTLPLLQTVSASADASGALSATVQFASAADEVAIDPDRVTVTVGGEAVTPETDVETGEITIALSGLSPGKHSVRVWASDESGRAAENEPLFIPLWVEDEPFEWQDGLVYFAFVDRFRNDDWGLEAPYGPIGVAECADYDGGDFLGVIHAMQDDYFEELGANVLWLTPVYENPDTAYIGMDATNYYSAYHGYWPVDGLTIEGHFSDTESDADDRLHELIEEAHARGIRVLFDLVLNHVHEDHTYVSEHPDWFTGGCICGTAGCDWDDQALECWFMDYLPDLNYRNHDVTMRVLADTLDLLQTYDVDAVRVDAAKHMDHVVMRSLKKRLGEDFEAGGGAPFYVVGETFTDSRDLIMDYVGDHELDGQFDFPLYYAIRDSFVNGDSFYELESAVSAGESAYGDALMSPFLGNHDVQRFASAITGKSGDCWSGSTEDPMAEGGSSVTEWEVVNKQNMAFAFTLTQPGVPLVYYGDEIGLHGGMDPDNRRVMNFDPYLSANQETLLARVQAIGQARAQSEALRRGDRVQLWVDDDLLVYARDNGGGDVAVVAMNKGGSSRSESVPVSALDVEGASFHDALGGSRTATVSGGALTVSLDSWEYVIFTR